MSAVLPCTSSIPSAPTGVVTTGRPVAIASTILPFSPAPNRRGAMEMQCVVRYGSTSGTHPVTVMSADESALTSLGGASPTMVTATS